MTPASLRYALAISLSAFLLFQVQPLIASYILPWFGGTPNVWTTCLLFFQGVLLAGYGYAFAIHRLPLKWQGRIHLTLLVASVLVLPIAPPDTWKPESPDFPALKILLLLLATVGGPYFVLSANAPLLQAWFARELPGKSPYRLYALSNAASMLGLLLYPFVVQPALGARSQAWAWSGLYVAFAVVCGWCALQVRLVPESPPNAAAASTAPEIRPSVTLALFWFLLSACGSAVMLGTTNDLTNTLAAVPFLWVLPLAIYLASFILTFERESWYRRAWWFPAFLVCALLVSTWGHVLFKPQTYLVVLLDSALVATGCVVCHGELVRSRPAARYLTAFYLAMAAGGAFGGVFVALLAPVLFASFWELPISLIAVVLLFGARAWTDPESGLTRGARTPAWAGMLLVLVLLGSGLALEVQGLGNDDSRRNFYGVLRLTEEDVGTDHARRTLYHGWTAHGSQYLAPEKQGQHLAYYGPQSGIAVAIKSHPKRAAGKPLHIGIIGLGAGAMSMWGAEGDRIRFYEINPVSLDFAHDPFTFFEITPAEVDVVLGDARISIEREIKHGEKLDFDLLVLDAFTGGSIPTHLLTVEALTLYQQALSSSGGSLVLHISNEHLDLERPIAGAAAPLGLEYVRIEQKEDKERLFTPSHWLVLSSSEEFLAAVRTTAGDAVVSATTAEPILWTDQRTSLLPILR